mmetsp:Transcript_25293/g.19049  ORF Transcript_25293/g.19049 Transcript_25293/m.19049 type:complete len:94 (+) Transcript_25293:434-715(+)|eukprot:CAMPEP_0202969964 /NCGR_PEP_ID=MMETSP1396-20130829/15879_1 /ASSEMBLY_ACC=CAM_ASM_000872 /TAXON_ID= /ORGANISM="Pseudokeronopsis sp., Strain Brazil" /LENGTH=93 /DNA_ID=CAMNT_0049698085 /DNA_START=626 /DNA_END=907 /DNA_ORIENTATION=-
MFILQENEDELLQMDFEEILNDLLEKPKQLLVENNSVQDPTRKEELFYHEVRKHEVEKGKMYIEYLLERFQGEFDESLSTAYQFKSPDWSPKK